MKTLITIAMVLIMSAAALVLSTLESLIGYLLLNVNWSLLIVLVISFLVIFSILKRTKETNNGKSI